MLLIALLVVHPCCSADKAGPDPVSVKQGLERTFTLRCCSHHTRVAYPVTLEARLFVAGIASAAVVGHCKLMGEKILAAEIDVTIANQRDKKMKRDAIAFCETLLNI